ncbi:MAG: SIS domain-containing protein [Phycisphaerae bacterium]|nr:SIS domain-containing protein [Phycisphaerae bacterium]
MRNEEKYTKFALAREMMETPEILRSFKLDGAEKAAAQIEQAGKLFLTGEGSSRLFPAKNIMAQAMRDGVDIEISTEGAMQAMEYDLSSFVVAAASNSGRTREIILLVKALLEAGHDKILGLTANKDTKLESLANQTFMLSCGTEDAVAATKSVAEQAIFYQALIAKIQGRSLDVASLADACEDALTQTIDESVVKDIAKAPRIYFAGRNDGVAEELTLKTNEITRKSSDFLEGTYLLHGVEEVMNAGEAVILIDPYRSELELIKKFISDGVGAKVIAIATEETIFPTIKVKDVGELATYVFLAAGWNVLVEVGIALGIDLDKPERARKIGNVFAEKD